MRKAIPVLASLLLTAALAASAFAAVVAEPAPGDAGSVNTTPDNLPGGKVPAAPGVLTVAYDNTTSAANFAFSSTDLTADWGDRLTTVATGLLSENKFTIYNSSSSAGPLLTAQVGVDFFDAVTSTYFGGYTTNINFGAGLAAGFFSTVTVTGIDPLLINLSTNDIIVIQSVLAKTGTANRLGIVSMNPPTAGSSIGSMYINAATVGAAGFYIVSGLPSNPGYKVSLAPPPVKTASKTWGELKKLYR